MRTKRLALLPWLVLAIALGVTWLVWDHERAVTQQQLRAKFDAALGEEVSRVEQRVAAYEQMLHGVQSLFSIRTQGPEAFREYVTSLQTDTHFPGVQSIGYVQSLQQLAPPDSPGGGAQSGWRLSTIRPPGLRPAYALLLQSEPTLGRPRVQPGLDLWSDPVLRLALEAARDSGAASISGQPQLALDGADDAPPSFIMCLPVYARGVALDSVERRRQQLLGWVFTSFRMQDLMADLYGKAQPGLHIAIYDGVAPSASTLLYRSDATPAQQSRVALGANEYLVFGGHSWTLVVTALDEFEASLGTPKAWLIAIAGTGLSLLLTLVAWLMATGQRRALRLADRMTRELRDSEERFQRLFESSPDAVVVVHAGAIHTVNREAEKLFGYERGELIGRPVEILLPPRLREGHAQQRGGYMQAPSRRHMGERQELLALRKDGSECPVDVTLNPIITSEGPMVISSIRDITDRRKLEDQVRQLAFFDPLTKLANRRLLHDRLGQTLVRAKRESSRFALLFVDLDRLKPVNDEHGHQVGDWLLQSVAKRIEGCLRASDTAARIGGDEFVVLLIDQKSSSDAIAVAEKIRQSLEQPLLTPQGIELNNSASIGVAIYPEHGNSAADLLRRGDDAMYRAKKGGGNAVAMARDEGSPRSDQDIGDTVHSIVRLSWKPAFAGGNAMIDQEHHELFVLANALLDQASKGAEDRGPLDAAFAALLKHVVEHFEHEESLLAALGYEQLEVHAALHRALIEQALALQQRCKVHGASIGELVEFLVEQVVAGHILREDRKFFPLLATEQSRALPTATT